MFKEETTLALLGNKKNLKKMASEYSVVGQAMAGTKLSLKGGNNSQISLKEAEEPVHLELEEGVHRPKDEGMNKERIEHLIEKKRVRVMIDAIHKAEKAKKETNMFGVVGITRKGGIPNLKLRHVNEADFF